MQPKARRGRVPEAEAVGAEQGGHEELMVKSGMYRDIYDLQLRPQEELLLDATVAGSNGGDS